ncbi:MAG: K+/H+ antiporter subunit F [Rhodobacterales bacterium]|nr:K+/H+ antiporter subunit F [Rhodobacterales bacterium]
MIALAMAFATGCFAIGLLLTLWRTIVATTTADRILALDTMVINMIALLVLFGISARSTLYFEVALVIAMVGFVSTVAYARFVLRGNIIE